MSSSLKEVDASIKSGEWDRALHALQALKSTLPAQEVYPRLARVQAVRGKYRSVLETFLELAQMLLDSQQLEEADSALQQLLILRPESGEARERRIEIERRRGNLERAIEMSRELARLSIEQGEGERSIRLLQCAASERPDNLDIALELAEMFVAHGHIADGASAFRRVAARFQECGDLRRAAEAYRRLKVVQSDDCEVMLRLGRLCIALGDFEDAEKELRAVLRHDLDHEEALLHLGWVCQLTGRFRSGLLAFNKVLQNQPDHAIAHRKVADLHISQGMTAEAAASLQAAARSYLRAEHTAEAIVCLRLILSLEPGHSEAQQGLLQLEAPLEPLPIELPGLTISPVPGAADPAEPLASAGQTEDPLEPEAPPEPRAESLLGQRDQPATQRPPLIRRGLLKVEFTDKLARPECKTTKHVRQGLIGKPLGSPLKNDKPPLPSPTGRNKGPTSPRPEPISARPEPDLENLVPITPGEDFGQELFAADTEPAQVPEPIVIPEPVFQQGQTEEPSPSERGRLLEDDSLFPDSLAKSPLSIFEPVEQVKTAWLDEDGPVGSLFDWESPDDVLEPERASQTQELVTETPAPVETDEDVAIVVNSLFDPVLPVLWAPEPPAAETLDRDHEPIRGEDGDLFFEALEPSEDRISRLFDWDLEPTVGESSGLFDLADPFAESQSCKPGFGDSALAESHFQQLDGLREVDDLSAVHDLGDVDDLSEVLGLKELEDFRAVHDLGEVDDLSAVHDLSDVDDLREVLGLKEPEDFRAVHDHGEVDDLRAVHDLSDVDDISEVPDLGEVDDLRAVHDLSDVDDISEVPDLGEVDDLSAVRDISEVPDLGEVDDLDELPDLKEPSATPGFDFALSDHLFESFSEPETDPAPVGDLLAIDERRQVDHSNAVDDIEESLSGRDVASLMAAYRAALEETPDNLVLRTRLADLLMKYGLLDEAVVHYRRAIDLQPDAVAPLRRAIQAELWNDSYHQAADSLIALAKLHLSQGEMDEALDALQAVLTLDPHHCGGLWELARLFASRHQEGLASYHFRQLAETALNQGDIATALAAFQQLVETTEGIPLGSEITPEVAATRYVHLLVRRGQLCEAGRALRRLEQAGGQGSEIAALIIQGLKAETADQPEMLFAYAELCYQASYLDHAIEAFQKTRRHRELERASALKLGLCLAAKQGTMMADLAARQFRRVLELPGLSRAEELEARYNLAIVQLENSRLPEGLAELDRCQRLEPNYRDVAQRIGQLQTELCQGHQEGQEGS